MDEIPLPNVLDPDRLLTNTRGNMTGEEHEQRANLLQDQLRESCDYAQQLWHRLDQVRAYLIESSPPSSVQPGTADRRGAHPTGPDDDEGWQAWIDAYAAVTSVLTGPRGDSGYGQDQGRDEARLRRTATRPATPHRDPDALPEPGAGEGPNAVSIREELARMRGEEPGRPGGSGDGTDGARPSPARSRSIQLAAAAGVAFLAGLLVRRPGPVQPPRRTGVSRAG